MFPSGTGIAGHCRQRIGTGYGIDGTGVVQQEFFVAGVDLIGVTYGYQHIADDGVHAIGRVARRQHMHIGRDVAGRGVAQAQQPTGRINRCLDRYASIPIPVWWSSTMVLSGRILAQVEQSATQWMNLQVTAAPKCL